MQSAKFCHACRAEVGVVAAVATKCILVVVRKGEKPATEKTA